MSEDIWPNEFAQIKKNLALPDCPAFFPLIGWKRIFPQDWFLKIFYPTSLSYYDILHNRQDIILYIGRNACFYQISD